MRGALLVGELFLRGTKILRSGMCEFWHNRVRYKSKMAVLEKDQEL